MPGSVDTQLYATAPDGRAIHQFTLRNSAGALVRVIELGGIVTELQMPDRSGAFDNLVLSQGNLSAYLADPWYLGAIVGRCANRIANSRFTLDGHVYHLAVNHGRHHLHGGCLGLSKVAWSGRAAVDETGARVSLHYRSRGGEEGYPGTLSVLVDYLLTEDNAFAIRYRAHTDIRTPVNLTHHSYFNLAGADSGNILDHRIRIDADAITAVNEDLIPTGDLMPVKGTPFDLREMDRVGTRLALDHPQLHLGRGFDHNYVLSRRAAGLADPVARVEDPASGRAMEVLTTEPGLQFYTGNALTDDHRNGARGFPRHAGLCLETQHFPDAPNQPGFPSIILSPGEELESVTIYRFSVLP